MHTIVKLFQTFSLNNLLVPLESELSLQKDVKLVSLDGQLALKKIELDDVTGRIADTRHKLG